MVSLLRRINYTLHKVPGERIFGIWRFLPFFFLGGASLEFAMIKWHVGETNFYKTYKRRIVQEEVERRLREREEKIHSQ